MCRLRTHPQTDVDPQRFLPPSNCHWRAGGGIVSPPRGDTLFSTEVEAHRLCGWCRGEWCDISQPPTPTRPAGSAQCSACDLSPSHRQHPYPLPGPLHTRIHHCTMDTLPNRQSKGHSVLHTGKVQLNNCCLQYLVCQCCSTFWTQQATFYPCDAILAWILAIAWCPAACVYHNSEFNWIRWTNRVGFGHGNFLQPILLL